MKSSKKLFALVLSIALIVSCCAISASAGIQEPLMVSGVGVTETGNVTNTLITEGTVSYDATNNTLTLSNATIKANTDESYQNFVDPIYYSGTDDLTVKVVGDCTLDCSAIEAYAIDVTNDNVTLNIVGEGDNAKLNIKMKANNDAVCVSYSTCDIAVSNLAVDVTYDGMGVDFAFAGNNVSFDNCDLKVKNAGVGIVANKSVTIKDSTIDFEIIIDGIGVYGDEDSKITITDSDIKTVENRAPLREALTGFGFDYEDYYGGPGQCVGLMLRCGLHCEGDIEISDTNLDIFSDETCGIYAKNLVAFDNCTGKIVTTSTGDERAVYSAQVTMSDDMPLTAGNTASDAKSAVLDTNLMDYKYVEFIDTSVKEETADDATWTKGTDKGQGIKTTIDLSKLVSVTVDGEEVDDEYYTVNEDSGIITFTPAFLETLSIGDHEVLITSSDGDATGTLTIKEKSVSPEPTTEPEEETTEPVEETTEPVEETTTEALEEEPEVVADTSDKTVIGAFVALGTLASAGYISLKKKED